LRFFGTLAIMPSYAATPAQQKPLLRRILPQMRGIVPSWAAGQGVVRGAEASFGTNL